MYTNNNILIIIIIHQSGGDLLHFIFDEVNFNLI